VAVSRRLGTLALVATIAGCGLTDEDGPLAGLTGECRSAIHDLERERRLEVDVTFLGIPGALMRFSDAGLPPFRAATVIEPPDVMFTADPAGRWTGFVDFAHSRLSVLLLADALPSTRGNVERVELSWQHPGQDHESMAASMDVSAATGSARVEGNEVVAEVRVAPEWGPVTAAAGAEGIVVDLVPDTGDRSVASYASPAPGQAVVRIPVVAFTGAPPTPGTQVEIPLVARFSYRPDLDLTLLGGDDPLPDYGNQCDRERTDAPPDTHDFSRYEYLNVYVIARLVAA